MTFVFCLLLGVTVILPLIDRSHTSDTAMDRAPPSDLALFLLRVYSWSLRLLRKLVVEKEDVGVISKVAIDVLSTISVL